MSKTQKRSKAELINPTLEVKSCARCGKRHGQLTFQKLKNPIYAGPFETLTHWAMCPELDQPILMGHRELTQFAVGR